MAPLRIRRRDVLAGAVAGLGRPALARAPAPVPRLRRGVNAWPWFSLTKEYPAPRTDYAWPPFQDARPVPRDVDLRRLRRAGFDFLRLPVDPGPFLSVTGPKRSRLLATLMEAVSAAGAADLTVVVNLQINEATHYWNSARLIASRDAPDFAAYRDLVREVARELGRLGRPALLLEPVNEPLQACLSATWTDVQMALLNAARAEAPDLALVATGGCGGMIPGLEALDPAPLLALGPVFFTFHYYEPYLFSHQGAPWMREPVYRALNSVPWPASAGTLAETLAAVRERMDTDFAVPPASRRAAYPETERLLAQYFDARPDRPFVAHAFERVQAFGRRHGIPADRILLGEFGALRSDARYVAARADDRARYVRDVRLTAEAYGFPWSFWNLFDGMGLMDDTTREFDAAILAALGLARPD